MHSFVTLWKISPIEEDGRVAQSTVFKRRPGTDDAASNEAVLRVVRDFVPPFVYRKSRNLIHRFKSKRS